MTLQLYFIFVTSSVWSLMLLADGKCIQLRNRSTIAHIRRLSMYLARSTMKLIFPSAGTEIWIRSVFINRKSSCNKSYGELNVLNVVWWQLSVTRRYLKIKCNVFSFVEVNFSTSVFNINKSIWVLRKITKIMNLLKKNVLMCELDDLFTFASDDVMPGKQTMMMIN